MDIDRNNITMRNVIKILNYKGYYAIREYTWIYVTESDKSVFRYMHKTIPPFWSVVPCTNSTGFVIKLSNIEDHIYDIDTMINDLYQWAQWVRERAFSLNIAYIRNAFVTHQKYIDQSENVDKYSITYEGIADMLNDKGYICRYYNISKYGSCICVLCSHKDAEYFCITLPGKHQMIEISQNCYIINNRPKAIKEYDDYLEDQFSLYIWASELDNTSKYIKYKGFDIAALKDKNPMLADALSILLCYINLSK